MSVNSELSLLKQPANHRVLVNGGSRVVYFRGMSLFTLETTGKSERTGKSQTDLEVPHAKSIIAIACQPGSEQIIIVGFDTGVIYRVDLEANTINLVHNEHKTKGQPLTWMGLHVTEKGIIISVVENSIIQYCSLSKKIKAFNSILPKKFNATDISATTLDPNLLAIGSFCGLLVILSIQDMTIKYSFRGHNYQITSMVWMRNLGDNLKNSADNEDCFDIYANDLKEEFGTDQTRHLDSDAYQGTRESPPSNQQFDFVEACQMLKEDMLRAKQEPAEIKPVQPDREECQNDLDESGESLPSGFSNDSNASMEQLFEKIDINDAEDLTLITLDQHMNVWVWDVRENRAKGNFKITSRSSKQKKPVYYPAQFYLLDDSQTIVGNTCNSGFFSLVLYFDKHANQLDFDYQVSENNSLVLGPLSDRQFLAFYPYHSMNVMHFDDQSRPNIRVIKEFPVYNSVGRTISVCNVNPMRVAIGSHEICLFDLMSVNDSGCNFSTYYKNIKSGIVCLAWHPENETMAFGTLEGRVGIYNTVNKSVEFLKPFSGHEIYDLAFARIKDEICLVATSNGVCVYYYNQFKDFKAILGGIKDISALYIDHVKNMMFIGTKQGNVFHRPVEKIEELNASLDPIKISRNYIRMFRVNCDHSQLVVAAKSQEVIVLSMSDLLAQNPTPKMIKLKGHSQPLVWVDFSVNNPNLLISTSYDQTIRLWDLSKCSSDGEETANVSAISCFSFNVKLKYAIFSPLNENCIIVGTQSAPFYVFNMNEKTTDFPPKIASVNANVQEKAGPAVAQNSTPAVKTESKVSESKKTETTVFYLTKRESSKKVLQCLQAIVKADVNNDDVGDEYLNQKLFSNDLDRIRDFLLEEAKNYQASNIKSRGTELIALMRGNMKETIMQHVQSKTLTDEMIGISPMVSYQFWRQCCEAYSVQMIEEQQPLKAVIYLLGLHRVDDAIKLLCDRHFFREAWILAKMRKFAEDPIFSEISTKWISHLDLCGDYESAAVVAAGIHDYKTALELLLKRHEEQLTGDHQEVIEALKLKLKTVSSAKKD